MVRRAVDEACVVLEKLFYRLLDLHFERDDGWCQPASLPPHAVYNAAFSPTRNDKPATLVDKEKTEASFFLGQPTGSIPIPEGKWTANPKLLENKSNIPLTITMTCPFCDSQTVFKKVATYFKKRHISSQVKFEFVPLRVRTQNGVGTIAFQVASRGVQYDNIAIKVDVSPPEEAKKESGEPLTSRSVTLVPSLPEARKPPPKQPDLLRPRWARKVDLTITILQRDGHVFIQLEPDDNEEIKKILGGKYVDREMEIRLLSTGLTVPELSK